MLLNKMRGRIRELYHCPVQGHGSAQMLRDSQADHADDTVTEHVA